jgi:hypothetical protein
MCANFRIADRSEINANEDKVLDEAIEDLSCGLLCLYVCQISTQEVKTQ